MKNWELIKPFVVLVSICLIVGIALGITNFVTEPIIERNAAEKAREIRVAVLPDAVEFVEVENDPQWDVNDVYEGVADGKTVGYVISVTRKGYKSVTVTVGIGVDGEIVGMSVDASSETSGIGSKVAEEDYIQKFLGLKGGTAGGADGVDIISQATYSSRGVKECVNAAFSVYEAIGGAE